MIVNNIEGDNQNDVICTTHKAIRSVLNNEIRNGRISKYRPEPHAHIKLIRVLHDAKDTTTITLENVRLRPRVKPKYEKIISTALKGLK